MKHNKKSITLRKIIYYTSIIFLVITSHSFAQKGSIEGIITDDNGPIPGVNVFLMNTSIGGISGSEGFYKITNIPAGEYEIRYSAVGYKSIFITQKIFDNKTVRIDITLDLDIIEVEEVKVTDRKIQEQSDTRASLLNVKPASARVLPGAVTDVFRTLQAMPGVLAPNDFSSQLIVRGSGPDQNLIVMDDVEIFNPYRLYGVISMFNPEAVADINLITGGFPAKYGDRLSAVLDITNRQGNISKNFTGNINASIVSANVVLEGKNPLNIPGSWLINSRRTYYDLIIEPFVKNTGLVEDNVSFPNFYDVQTKLVFGPFSGNKFFINGIYSRDGVEIVSAKNRTNPDSIGVFDLTKNDLASFAWHYAPNNKLLNKVIVSWYRNSGDSDFDSKFLDPSLNRDNFEEVAPDTLKPYLLGFSLNSNYKFAKSSISDELLYVWGNDYKLEAGIGVDFMKTTIDFDFDLDPQLQAFLNSNSNVRSSIDDLSEVKEYKRYHAYLSNNFRIGNSLYINPGVRFDHYDILNKSYVAPRLSVSYALNEITTIRGTWGMYYQSPGYEKLRDRNLFLNFSPQYTDPLEAEKAVHYVLSFERWLTSEWFAKIEGYYKKFDDLIVQRLVAGTGYYSEAIPGKDPKYAESLTRPVPTKIDSATQIPVNNSFGEAYGLEFLLEKRNIDGNNKFDGWVSYSYAFANRFEEGLKLPFRFDQRHTFNFIMNYKINNWLDLGVRFQYGSGFPITEAKGIKPRIALIDTDGDFEPDSPIISSRGSEVIYDVDFGDRTNRYQSRKPAYHRLDLRLSAFTQFWDFDWTFYLDVINIYNRSNIVGYDYFIDDDLSLKRESTSMFPILPTIGFNARF
ncbi:MAG: TonB-dependent receptor [Melioribacteraceae bacterium]|nr:TonB-dependent receptor [Melioribacteraceae bacterium]MCF8353101.1 TonB-dependent receptor [Melioribacteraceae bacterium]MCF8392753.1 TonB-dependent receptor [Melioribacteraceae bacterium]